MEAPEVKERAFAIPLTSPSYPRGPYRFTDREHMIVTYRTDSSALELAVPEPLEAGDPLVRLEFMRMGGSTGFGRYSGAAQHVPVHFGAQAGAYTHAMFLDVHAPISGGRELWGFPQKLAAPRLAVAHDVLLGTLDYGPERVATATMGYKHGPIADDAALAMLNELLASNKPLSPTDVARQFKGGKQNERRVRLVLDALARLGHLSSPAGGTSFALRRGV